MPSASRTRPAPKLPELPAGQPGTYEAAYPDGYVQGVRDAAGWSVEAFGRLLRAAEAARAVADAFVEQARAEVENAQKRWAENADLRDDDQTDALAETGRGHAAEARERGARKRKTAPAAGPTPGPASDPQSPPEAAQPTLNLATPEAPEPPDSALSDEQRAKRAAGLAWRA